MGNCALLPDAAGVLLALLYLAVLLPLPEHIADGDDDDDEPPADRTVW